MRIKKYFLYLFVVLLATFVSLFCVEIISFFYIKNDGKIQNRSEFRLTQPKPYQTSKYYSKEFVDESIRSEGIGAFGDKVRRLDDFYGVHINIKDGYRYTLGNNPENFKRIHIYGGSTIFSAEVPDEYTIPSILQKLINKAGYNYSVVNHGVCSMNSYQQLQYLMETNLNKGDIVVFYDGVNDAIYNVFYGYEYGLTKQADIFKDKLDYFHRSILPGLKKINLNNLSFALEIYSKKVVNLDGKLAKNRSISAGNSLYTNVKTANLFTSTHRANFYHFLQPNLFEMPRKSDYGKFLLENYKLTPPGLDSAFTYAYPHLKDATIRMSKDGIKSFDVSGAFNSIGDGVYLDFCHVNEIANDIMANVIFDAIFKKEIIKK